MADQHNDPSRHPSSDPHFDAKREHEVWYLGHPLAGDAQYTFQQNMDHVIHMMRICYEEGFIVVAPYHTICLALDDDNSEWRRIGLECDCNVVRKLGRVILCGHKLSSGMGHELASCASVANGVVHVLVGHNDEEFRATLRFIKNGGTIESDESLHKEV